MHVVIAPDSFKGSIDAASAATAIANGWERVRPSDLLLCIPMADGGEGTLEAVSVAVPGAEWKPVPDVTGPDGNPVDSAYLLLPSGTAMVELALSSGLPLLSEMTPLRATSRGLGEVISAALDGGADQIVIGLGGSASTDGGVGALRALGMEVFDASGHTLDDGGSALQDLAHIDVSGLRPPPPRGVKVLTDVDNPLLGERGAAATFGWQKGAGAAEVEELAAALARFARLAGGDAQAPGTGAAGGTAFGLATYWHGKLCAGSDVVAETVGLADAIGEAAFVITGEGRFDPTSLSGKVVGHVVSLAKMNPAVDVAVIAGSVDRRVCAEVRNILSLAGYAGSVEAAIGDPCRWLEVAAADLALMFSGRDGASC